MSRSHKQTEAGSIPDDWDVRSLGSLVDPGSPICYGVVQVGQNDDDGVPIVAIKFVKEIAHAPLHRTSKKLEAPYARSRPKGGDVLISIKGTIGRVGVVPHGFEGNISRELARLRIGEGISPAYVAHQLEANVTQERIMRSVVGTTRLEFSIGAVRQFEIAVPRKEVEQQAIAEALNDADELVRTLDQLIAKKRDIRQAVMQQLLTGQTRLPGFHGEWKVNRLGDVLESVVGGGTPSRGNAAFWGNEIPWATVKDFATFDPHQTQEGITQLGLKNSASNLIPAGTLITSTRMALGKAVVYEVDVAINQDLKALFLNEKATVRFLCYWFEHFGRMIDDLGSGSTVKGISVGELKGLRFYAPKPLEQSAIAETLSAMDAELTALARRREKTRAIKQAMMQELLTGKTRLVSREEARA